MSPRHAGGDGIAAVSLYVPGKTFTVSPGHARSIACWMVLHGLPSVRQTLTVGPGRKSAPDGDT